MDGRTMARGRSAPSVTSMLSASCFVNVYVLGLCPIRRGVIRLIISSSIHLNSAKAVIINK